MSASDFFSGLPSELGLNILEHVAEHPLWLCRMQQTSHFWAKLATDDGLWRSCCLRWNFLGSTGQWRQTFQQEFTTLRNWHTPKSERCIQSCSLGNLQVCGLLVNERYTIVAGSDIDGTIHVLDTETGEFLRTLSGHGGGAWTPSFGSSPNILLAAGPNRILKVWDLSTGQCIHSLEGHTSTIRCIVSIPNTSLVVTASRDCTLRCVPTVCMRRKPFLITFLGPGTCRPKAESLWTYSRFIRIQFVVWNTV